MLPIDNRAFSDRVNDRPNAVVPRERYVYRPSAGMVPEETAADVRNRDHRVTATVVVDAGAPEGVLAQQGNVLGGWSLHLDSGDLVWHCNVATRRIHEVRAPITLSPGRHELAVRYDKTTEIGGHATLLVDGEPIADGEVSWHCLTRWSMTGSGLRIGRPEALPPCDDPGAARPFSAELETVVIDVAGPAHHDPEQETATAMAVQ